MRRDGRRSVVWIKKADTIKNHRTANKQHKKGDAPTPAKGQIHTKHSTDNKSSPENKPHPEGHPAWKIRWWRLRIKYAAMNKWRFFEGLGILAAVFYAGIAYLQWFDANKNFRVDQRAWVQVRVKNDPKTLEDYKNPSQLIEIVNVGKSPATHIVVTTQGEILDNAIGSSFDYGTPGYRLTIGILFPNATEETRMGSPIAFSERQRNDLAEGNSYLTEYASVTFNDIFGVSHWTHFCVYRVFAVPKETGGVTAGRESPQQGESKWKSEFG
jgi:hypothetical protein